ncbi:MAG: STAS/SEC14 domain-containing protein [Myxococcales bacterium]|nr:STAS/SEC14 domain-containing protein [Myxococcales bacterium]MCB9712564.1 STAS/SEC14 domain-containing protein [Myxococcales bacterium]
MYEISTEDQHHLVSYALVGSIDVDETARFADELRWALERYGNDEIKLLADLRAFKPTSSSVAELMQRMQKHALRAGVVRIAEITASRHLAVQMAVVAKRSGAASITRRFDDLESAKDWLIGDPPAPQ